jgi:hypothetical protein
MQQTAEEKLLFQDMKVNPTDGNIKHSQSDLIM